MLPSQLLRGKVVGGKLILKWALGSELELAEDLIRIFKVGRELKEIEEEEEEIEEYYSDYKLVRGLYTLLLRRGRFERPKSSLDPLEARRRVYRIVNRDYHGFVSYEERADAIRRAAEEIGVNEEELERALWADFELKLVEFDAPEPEELLKEYNLALLQTALFKSSRMHLLTSSSGGEVKPLLRALKGLGLMYTASRRDKLELTIDGPASILKLTTKYGVAMAKLVPFIVRMSDWYLRADIVRRKIVRLEVSHRMRDIFPEYEGGIDYDSSLEREFPQMCPQGWKVYREPEPLVSGSSVIIPDFMLEKGRIRIYVEIMGFWTPEYVERKIEKLKDVKEPLLIIARRDLMCSRVEKIRKDILYFERKIDPVELARKLKEIEERYWSDERDRIREEMAELRIDGKFLEVDKLKSILGISEAQLREICCPEGFELIGSYLISEEAISSLREEVMKRRPSKVRELKGILADMGLPPEIATYVPERIGIGVSWSSLDEDEADLLYT
jgi:predicted nuclease of restriction endonuclease-like RecB superfamily